PDLFGSDRIISAASPPFHPQSQTSTRASGLPRCTPASIVEFTSAMIAAADRPLHRGQVLCCPCEAQFVRFSDAEIVNTPPRLGTVEKTCASASPIHRLTCGSEVHIAVYSPSRTPAICGRFLKNSAGIARGSFMYK